MNAVSAWSGQIATTAEDFTDVVRQYLDQVVDVLPDGRRSLFRITDESRTRLQIDRFTFAEGGTWDPGAQSWVEAVRETVRQSETVPGSLTVEVRPRGALGAERLRVTITCYDAGASDLCAALIDEIGREWPEARQPAGARPLSIERRERRERIRQLFNEGKANYQIAKELDISESTLLRELAAMGLRRRKR